MIKYHLLELKYRLMYIVLSISLTMLVLWGSKEKVIYSITSLNLIYTELWEAFISFLEMCFCISVLFNVPYLMFMCYGYLEEGLYSYEVLKLKKYMWSLLLLFFLIVLTYLLLILPYLISFFSSFDTEWLSMSIKIGDVVSILILLIESSLFTVLLPLLSWTFSISRKYIILLILFFSAVITPPDVISQLLLGVPLMILFEFSLCLGYYLR